MPSRNRETLLALALVFAVAALSVAGAILGGSGDAQPALDSSSTGPDGARALYQWLEELGYPVSDAVETAFAVPDGAELVFVLEPLGMTAQEAGILADWVEDGGVLVLAGRYYGSTPLLAAFEVERGFRTQPEARLAPAVPLLADPPVTNPVPVDTDGFLEPGFDDFLPLVAGPGEPVVLVFEHGAGRVVLSASTEPFTNAGLKEPGAGEFVLNVVGQAPAGAPVWFDEWHHGRRPVEQGPSGPGDWLRRTPAGRAVLYAAGVLFAWIALTGRGFGRPVRPAGERPRRAPLEYITAIAGLNQLAGNRAEILAGYHRRLKRALAARYRLDPDLPDDLFIDALGRYDPGADLGALEAMLGELRRTDVSENEMVRLVSQAADMLAAGSLMPLQIDAKAQRRKD